MAEFLKNNALDFLKEAERNLEEKKNNLAMFHLEQSLQLALKYMIYQHTGSFPKTHDVVELLNRVSSLINNSRLIAIIDSEITTLNLLKQAYIASRYFPISYDEKAAQKSYDVVREILHELGLV